MNLDKQLAYLDGDKSALSEEDLDIMSKMTLPFWEGTKLLEKYKHLPCTLRDDQIVLDKEVSLNKITEYYLDKLGIFMGI